LQPEAGQGSVRSESGPITGNLEVIEVMPPDWSRQTGLEEIGHERQSAALHVPSRLPSTNLVMAGPGLSIVHPQSLTARFQIKLNIGNPWRTREPNGRNEEPGTRLILVLQSVNLASQDSNRSFWQSENGSRLSFYGDGHRRIVGISMTVGPVVDPHILLAAKGHKRDRP
jgi:hypothetical protein